MMYSLLAINTELSASAFKSLVIVLKYCYPAILKGSTLGTVYSYAYSYTYNSWGKKSTAV